MALLKKINPAWAPSENPGLTVGGTVDITDYTALVKSGAAVLVDESGRELPLPGQVYECPICFKKSDEIEKFTAHVATHQIGKAPEAPVAESVAPVAEVETSVEEASVAEELKPSIDNIRARRIENLKKAREARMAKAKK